VQTQDFTAPSYATLRPLKPQATKTFPVYDDLAGRLLAAHDHPDPEIAHALAVCAGYAYSDGETVAMIMARLGLEDNRCRMISEYVDVMFITSTSFLVQSRDGRVVILCYRGTPPTDLITWLTDIDVNPAKIRIPSPSGPGEYEVHGGFYRNVRSTRYEIVRALERALEGRSVLADGASMPNPMEALYITGHSLGAASASMLAVMLVTEPRYAPIVSALRAVYTFGQPMIAGPELAERCREDVFLDENVIRYVYADDIAPQLPPKVSGPFEHFGTEYHYRPDGDGGRWQFNERPRGQLASVLELLGNPLSFLARQVKLTRRLHFHASVYDHLPQLYITALTPPGVRSEFGD
jgi:Lipase (class 3)